MKKWNTRKLVTLGLFLAFGTVFNFVENVLINVPIMPGIKLGIANTITLIVLYYYGWKEYVIIGLLRVLLTALMFGFGMGTLIALGGWFLSVVITLILYSTKKFSLFGISMSSAVFHGLGQIIVVSMYYQTSGMFILFPILGITGLISGLLIALLVRLIIKHLPAKLVVGAKT